MHRRLIRSKRNYRFLLLSSATSNLGDGIAFLAFPWLATSISRDPMHISFVALATRLPWFLFSLPAGVIIDRIDRQWLMVASDIIRVILSLVTIVFIVMSSMLVTAGAGTDPFTEILVLSFITLLLGTAEVFRDNAAQTVLPSIVESTQLEKANGQLWSLEQVMGSFVGPPLAGFLITVSLVLPFGFNAVAFGLSACLLWMIRFPPRMPGAPRQNFYTELSIGIAWIRNHRVLLQLAVMLGLLNAFTMTALAMLVLFSQDILLLSAAGHGILLTS